MMAYRVDSATDPDIAHAGSCHDGESHADVRLADVISKAQCINVAVFVVRYYGGIQLRGQRLRHISDCGRTSLNKLRFPEGVMPSNSLNGAEPVPGGSKRQNTAEAEPDFETEEINGECNSIHSSRDDDNPEHNYTHKDPFTYASREQRFAKKPKPLEMLYTF